MTITVKQLKALLEQVPDDADIEAYEGERTGFNIRLHMPYKPLETPYWWIDASGNGEDIYTEGFDNPTCDFDGENGGECYNPQCKYHCGDEPICCYEK